MSQSTYYTQEGFEEAKKELRHLQTTEMTRITQEMADAIAQGDLSENAEFDAAKEAQQMLSKQIAELQTKLGNARIVSPENVNTSQVSILSKVTLKNTADQTTLVYTLVPPSEANLSQGKISVASPIGKGLLGKKVGDKTSINIPAGSITYEILDITV